jgi:transposase-like protein
MAAHDCNSDRNKTVLRHEWKKSGGEMVVTSTFKCRNCDTEWTEVREETRRSAR